MATQQKLSASEYLQQLRERRQQKHQTNQPTENTTPAEQPGSQNTYQEPAQQTYANATEQNQAQPQQQTENFPNVQKQPEEELVLQWEAYNRPFKKRNKEFYVYGIVISGLTSLILVFMGQFLPIAAVLAVTFAGYALYSVPPQKTTNKITTFGIRTEEEMYYWDQIGRFWFDVIMSQKVVQMEVATFPGRLTLVLNNTSEAEIRAILSEILLEQRPADTAVDKAGKWLKDRIPLDS